MTYEDLVGRIGGGFETDGDQFGEIKYRTYHK